MWIRLKKKNQLIWFMSEMTSRRYRQEQHVLEKELLEAISSLQTTPENEERAFLKVRWRLDNEVKGMFSLTLLKHEEVGSSVWTHDTIIYLKFHFCISSNNKV